MDDEERNSWSRRDFLTTGLAGAMAVGLGSPLSAQAAEPKRPASVVLITGGTSGLGKALVRSFAEAGSKVVFCGRDEERGREIVKQVTENKGTASFLRADIRLDAEVRSLIQHCVEIFGRLDIAVNNAGVRETSGDFLAAPLESLLNVVNTNLTGTIHCLRHELEQMQKQKSGVIVNIASNSAMSGDPLAPTYSASKCAVIGLTRNLTRIYAKDNIRINSISPGPFKKMGEHLAHNKREGAANRVGEHGSHLRILDLVSAVHWICSSGAGAVGGQDILVDWQEPNPPATTQASHADG